MPKYESQSDVIRAIKKANDAELRALADVSRQIKNISGAGGGLRYVKSANAGKYRQPAANELGNQIAAVTGGKAPISPFLKTSICRADGSLLVIGYTAECASMSVQADWEAPWAGGMMATVIAWGTVTVEGTMTTL